MSMNSPPPCRRWSICRRGIEPSNSRRRSKRGEIWPNRHRAFTSLTVAADDGPHGFIGAEILRAFHIEQRRKLRAGAVDTALDGTDGAAANRGRILIGKAGSADQNQRLALILRQL